jgi:HSP20 family protein
MYTLMPKRRERETAGVLARRKPAPFELLRREFASLFERAFPGWVMPFETLWAPNEPLGLELKKKEGEWVVKVAVPGFEVNELEVTLRDNLLTVRAEHEEEAGKSAAEHPPARLEEVLTLPEGFEPEKVEARYRNGLLEIHLPLAPEAKPRRIEVKAGA